MDGNEYEIVAVVKESSISFHHPLNLAFAYILAQYSKYPTSENKWHTLKDLIYDSKVFEANQGITELNYLKILQEPLNTMGIACKYTYN